MDEVRVGLSEVVQLLALGLVHFYLIYLKECHRWFELCFFTIEGSLLGLLACKSYAEFMSSILLRSNFFLNFSTIGLSGSIVWQLYFCCDDLLNLLATLALKSGETIGSL